MNILHYLNVLIGFSLVMLVLSIVTSSAAQAWLFLLRTKNRVIGTGLINMLIDIGFEKDLATLNVNALLTQNSSIFSERLEYVGKLLNRISAYFLTGAPKDIGREEFLFLLLRKAAADDTLAAKLSFTDKTDADNQLAKLEKAMLKEETANPNLPAHIWRTKAIQDTVPDIAAKIFARFDETIDRATEEVSTFCKFLSIIITLPLLLIYWPVDSITLLNRLNNDTQLSVQLADIAQNQNQTLQQIYDERAKCLEVNKNNPDAIKTCDTNRQQVLQKTANNIIKTPIGQGLFGSEVKKDLPCTLPLFDWPIPFLQECKRAELTHGLFITWILVSLGSAFWFGALNKMLGIRSEFSKKLDGQREFRAVSHP